MSQVVKVYSLFFVEPEYSVNKMLDLRYGIYQIEECKYPVDWIFILHSAFSFHGLEFRNSNAGKIISCAVENFIYFSGYTKFVFNLRVFDSYLLCLGMYMLTFTSRKRW